jgi:hypothetical protein
MLQVSLDWPVRDSPQGFTDQCNAQGDQWRSAGGPKYGLRPRHAGLNSAFPVDAVSG